MTRAKVLQLGLLVLSLGAIGFLGFRFIGFDEASAGIAAEAVLISLILIWTGSYIFRVVTGKMTFSEQRKRYREAYDSLAVSDIQSRFDSMSEEDQTKLIKELGLEEDELKNL